MKKRKDGRWEITKVIDGKRVHFFSHENTEKRAIADIERQMLSYNVELQKNTHNFKFIADRMLESRSATIEENTLNCYRYALDRAKSLYKYNIEDIEPFDIQAILNTLARENYSFSAVSKTKTAIGLVFDYAIVDEGLRISNFMRSIKLPRNLPKPEVKHPEEATIRAIVKNAMDTEFGLWALTALFTGCRRGELNALQVKDVNLEKRTISISKSTAFLPNQPVLKAPKSKYSVADVPIFEMFKPYIAELIKGKRPNDFIFGGETPFSKTQIRKRWDKYCKQINTNFTEHQLRHAYALLLYRASVPPKTAQKYLRHSSFVITMDIYTAFDNEYSNEKLIKIDDLLGEMFAEASQKSVKGA